MKKQAIRGKRKARRLVLQALYQWLMAGAELSEIEAQFRVANDTQKVDMDYFCRFLYGIPKHLHELEEEFRPFLDRDIKELNPIELTVLRMGTFELHYCPETPYRVVLDEAILLTKEFGSQDGYRYVNGVLNQVARKSRKVEMNLGHE
ncbi:transcription antitermination factor NusB [Legionella israelensis]|uniref:transcription antitermination factor NusB n=1 Tax=Legionella israelensis TaxID=454 RepID=UPI00117E1405|nr:transcription antitermination factor NusB [Legionella israelensis]QDP72074.1 transcription antitermination factor NusB [Legionella israelensis]